MTRCHRLWISLAATLLAAALVSCGNDWRESFYQSFEDARKDGAIMRGWIPAYLPTSAKNIHEIHRIEHSRTYCAFEYRPQDEEILRRELVASDPLPSSVMRIASPGVAWWPTSLQRDIDVRQLRDSGYELFIHLEPGIPAIPEERLVYLFAINWSKGSGYFYQTIDHSGPLPSSSGNPARMTNERRS